MILRASTIIAIATGLLFVVLAHDAVMAADPHANHRSVHEVATDQGADPACGPTELVRPADVVDPHTHAAAGSPIGWIWAEASIALAPAAPQWWTEPDAPPDVRRALLQVFRN